MKRIISLSVLIIVFVVIISCDKDKNIVAPVDEVVDSISWVGTDFIYSNTTIKKPYTLLYFYTDWCSWCRKMNDEVFSDSTVINLLHNNYNSIKINSEIDSSVVYFDSMVTCRYFVHGLFQVSGYPHIFMLDSLNQEIDVFGGYAPAAKILTFLKTFIK